MALASPFRSERTVTPGAPGPNRLDVDVALLAGAQPDLRDLRLFDAQGREAGYLLVPPAATEPAWSAGRILPIASTKKTSGFELDLGSPIDIDRARVEGLVAPFLKRVTVEGSGDRARWTLLSNATVFDLPDEKLRRTEIAFAPGRYRYLRFVWDDSSSARVSGSLSAAARAHGPAAGPEGVRFDTAFQRRPHEPGKTRYRVILPGQRLPIAAIEVEVAGGNVFRTATITEPRLGNGQVTPVALGQATLKRTERDGIVAAEMIVPISSPLSRELDLVIDDGNNAPLVLSAVRARLAPQPWIYFESADGSPLRARYGGESATVPRYDIEASRPFVQAGKTALATWSPSAMKTTSPESNEVALPPGALVDRERFRVSRKLPDAPAGLTLLLLDAHVLARRNDLADVRLVDPSGRQVPYLVETRAEPLVIQLSVPSPETSGGRSVYRLELPYSAWPAGSQLVLTTSARVFERTVTLKRVADNHRNRVAGVLATAVWRTSDPEVPPPALRFDAAVRGTRTLELIVDEGDNAPLPITSAQLLVPSRALRFHHPGTALFLLYENRRAAAPRYDLALLAPRLFSQPARELSLGPETIAETPEEDPSDRRLFWIGIVIAAVVLIALLLRLLLVNAETSRAPNDTT